MTQGVIYLVDGDGLRRMMPSAPESEDRMQALVAQYPELITDGDGDLLLIKRESAIGDGETSGRWSLDHLFVTRAAVPVLVELKRAVDTRLRREVVGQMLDYAANATVHWGAGAIAEVYAKTVGLEKADSILADFIGDRDPEEFWGQVDANLRAGRVKLVFVADIIPRELARIVEFLNSQMRADVRAVELRWFTGDDGMTTLSPRVIGESEESSASKASGRNPPMDVASWIADKIDARGSEVRLGVETFCTIVEKAGGEVSIPSTRGSIMTQWRADDGKYVYPVGVSTSGRVVLRLAYLVSRPAFADELARKQLYDRLAEIVGSLHTQSLLGEPGFPATLLNDPTVATAFTAYLETVVSAGKLA